MHWGTKDDEFQHLVHFFSSDDGYCLHPRSHDHVFHVVECAKRFLSHDSSHCRRLFRLPHTDGCGLPGVGCDRPGVRAGLQHNQVGRRVVLVHSCHQKLAPVSQCQRFQGYCFRRVFIQAVFFGVRHRHVQP